ncbi:MAG: hypothetical protein N4A33_00180 [Bacteriovoracaceae bacterium]|nr:hypothetical protein [Bacteriovoracaceae bacterium]
MKRRIIPLSILATIALSSSSFAEEAAKKRYPMHVYPFKAMDTNYIVQRIKAMAEDNNAITNVVDTESLKAGKTKELPWSSTYWPLLKGGTANPYGDKETLGQDIANLNKTLNWKKNYKVLKKRQEELPAKIAQMSEEELARLAPTEKYDLLLGDYSFDLTKRQVAYMKRWGEGKKYSDIGSIDKDGNKVSLLNKIGGGTLQRAKNMMKWGWKYYDGSGLNLQKALKMANDEMGGIADKYALRKAQEEKNFELFELFLEEGKELAIRSQSHFILNNPGKRIATWEGICNGWSTAAGIMPRPLHSFEVKLPNGKNLKFYPADIKALMSQLWFNSLIQDGRDPSTNYGGVLSQGLRCNEKAPKKDEWGRFYDSEPDKYANKGIIEPRCVGVHPAIWHFSLINIIGKQKRSFVVERKVKAAVDNHPMSDYKFEYFHPNTGEYGSLSKSVARINKEDQFKEFRNKKATHIVGVKMTMAYMNWIRPSRLDKESAAEDYKNRKEINMFYDLEMDAKGNILGGQWRTTEVGKNFLGIGADRTQPDFFWTITKDWKKTGYFDNIHALPKWEDTSTVPPKEWKQAAHKAHKFIYKKAHNTSWYEKCQLKRVTGAKDKNNNGYRDSKENTDIKTASAIDEMSAKEIRQTEYLKDIKFIKVPCELHENKPLPLTNVVNKLLELSRK